jgi:hypothetical protein
LALRTNNVNRFLFQVTATPETGGNAGSNWVLLGRADNGGVLNAPLFLERSTGRLVLGGTDANPTTRAKVYIVQPSTTDAIPVLLLEQSDLSEEFIEFAGTVGAGNAIDTAALGTYYGKVRVSVNGTYKYIALYNS